jgi:hypothetical protein
MHQSSLYKYDLTAIRAGAQTDRAWAIEYLITAGADMNAADKVFYAKR